MIAQISSPSLPADTLERVNQIDARAAVQARTTSAVVDVLVAVHPCVSRIANTSTAAASASASARRAFATAARLFVHDAKLWIVGCRLRTVLPLPLFWTVAIVVRLRVEAWRGISAWIRAAVIPVDLALISGETDWTHALVRVHQVSAFSAVLARLRGALVDVHVAILARVSRGTAAVIVVDQVDAQRSVLTLTDAVVDVLRAILPRETAPAATPKIRSTGSRF